MAVIKKVSNTRLDVSVLPEIAFTSIVEGHFENDKTWQNSVDIIANHGTYNLITLTMRLKGHPIVDPQTKELFRKYVDYAGGKGIGVLLDLDPRLAREEFYRRYPDEMQKVIILKELPVQQTSTDFEIKSFTCGDHMTGGGGTPYFLMAGRFVKAFAGDKNDKGEIVGETLKDISQKVNIKQANAEGIVGTLISSESDKLAYMFVLVEFGLFSPDVFSPHIIGYQQELIRMYADLPLKGVVKDEWGFPPTQSGMINHKAFWYSEEYDLAYRQESGRGSLLDDFLLMSFDFQGRKSERLYAINNYMGLNYQRNKEIECCYYDDVKAVYGQDAIVMKHPTWSPRINGHEIFKNGLDWWSAKRDWAQTDEITPLSACTALSKKFNCPNWLNEGYSNKVVDYQRNIWRYALAGGRMVYHPLYPNPFAEIDKFQAKYLRRGLLQNSDLIRAQGMVRLLNFISRSPLDCPVALVFGHESLMNWAGEDYLDFGQNLSLGLWQAGYAVDLYPSSEIAAGTFEITENGYIKVGPQLYSALVLYNPNLCPKSVADFFISKFISKTNLYYIGNWQYDEKGRSFDGNSLLSKRFTVLDKKGALDKLVNNFRSEEVLTQTPLTEPFGYNTTSGRIEMPGCDGTAKLIDGTVIRIKANKPYVGDLIDETIVIDSISVKVKAEGLFAARVDKAGKLEAFAAGKLSMLKGPELSLNITQPLDIALWRTKGKWQGVVQGATDIDLPECLRALTDDWQFLGLPQPFDASEVLTDNTSVPDIVGEKK
ncbi:MAG: hypothetical protein JXD22_14325 [Sedimentisphaerales bacterium]|nr:hypothetical protein [Sedimentisphaerales bacterium]